MGQVYQATDTKLERDVALLSSQSPDEPEPKAHARCANEDEGSCAWHC